MKFFVTDSIIFVQWVILVIVKTPAGNLYHKIICSSLKGESKLFVIKVDSVCFNYLKKWPIGAQELRVEIVSCGLTYCHIVT